MARAPSLLTALFSSVQRGRSRAGYCRPLADHQLHRTWQAGMTMRVERDQYACWGRGPCRIFVP